MSDVGPHPSCPDRCHRAGGASLDIRSSHRDIYDSLLIGYPLADEPDGHVDPEDDRGD